MVNDPNGRDLEHRTGTVQTVMILILVMFILQLWLLTIAIEGYLAARHSMAVPTFIGSVACFLVNLRLLGYVGEIDRKRKAN